MHSGKTSPSTAYCGWRIRSHRGARIEVSDLRQAAAVPEGSDVLRMHLEGWYCPTHCYLWPRDLVTRLGGFDASLGADQDGDFTLRALATGAQLRYVPGVEVQYRVHSGGQVSRIRSRAKLRSRYRVARKIVPDRWTHRAESIRTGRALQSVSTNCVARAA